MEFGEVILKDMFGLCRCCLAEGCFKDLSSEYTSENGKEIYAEMLLECYDISLTQRTDSAGALEQLICEHCISRLRDAAQFKRQVVETEVRFLDMLGQGLLKPKVEVTELDLKTEAETPSDDDMGQFNNLDYEQGRYIPKTETKDIFTQEEAPETQSQSVLSDSDDAPLRPRAPPRKKRKRADACDSRNKIQKGAKMQKSLSRRRANLQIIFNNTTIIPFRWRGKYRCFYCGTVVQDYSELTIHTNTHGDCSIEDRGLKSVKGTNSEVKIDISKMSCKVCDESFKCFDEVVMHLVVKHKLEYDRDEQMNLECFRLVDLSCYKCSEKFNYFGYLVSHMNNAHPINCFTCDSCHQKFNKKRDLFCHIKCYHREGGYPCEGCSHNFSTLNILRKHQVNSHQTKCDVCSLKLPTAVLKQKHMKEEHQENGLKCQNCFKKFKTKQGLKMHSRKCRTQNATYDSADENFEDGTVKRETVKQIKQNIVSIINMSTVIPFSFYKNKFNCFYCSEDFTDSDNLREHTVMAHPVCDLKTKYLKNTCRPSNISVKIDISSLACKVCFEKFSDLDTLLQHLVSKHNTSLHDTLKSFLQPYRLVKDHMRCPHCPTQVFRFFSTLLRHINSAHTNNNIICAYCGHAFRKEHLLRVHIWRNHKEDQFKCSICLAECSMPSRLYMHMATVHGVKAAKCSKCGDRFATQYLRQKHMIDAHDLGHKCSYCNKLFVRNSFMKDHIRRTHLKEKNVECKVCGMKFFNNILLRHHMVKHSGEKNFHCDVCGERFLWRKGLVRHMRRHNK